MKNISQPIFKKLVALYNRMDQAYAEAIQAIGFSCEGCPDNCCISFFQHHTYVEWAFFWKGLEALPQDRRQNYKTRALAYVYEAQNILYLEQRPQLMCPINDHGLCGVYQHRLMICRLHGVPTVSVLSNGVSQISPGCFMAQKFYSGRTDVTMLLDRTLLYRDLARLEMEFLGPELNKLPRVNLTLAEMIVQGQPF